MYLTTFTRRRLDTGAAESHLQLRIGTHPGAQSSSSLPILNVPQGIIGQITDVAENIVFLIGGNAGTGYANHASQVSRAKRFPWRAGAGLDIQTRNRTRGFATPSDKQRLSIAGPAQGRVARL